MSESVMKKYVKVPDGRTFKVQVYYTLGGINYFSGSTNPRGYVLSVGPVEVAFNPDGSVYMESFTAFSGIKHTLVECKRKNKKSEAEAIAMVPQFEQRLIDHVLSSNSVFDRNPKKEVVNV
jgi:hypothetical protein